MTTSSPPPEIDRALQEARELMAAGRPQAALVEALKALHLALATLQGSLLTLQGKLKQLQGEMARLKELGPPPAKVTEISSRFRH